VKLLDLFSCAGGATLGYMRAGFIVTAVDVDLNALRRNPANGGTLHADALDVLRGGVVDLSEYDVIHASPPCQAYSVTRHAHDVTHPDLVPETLALLAAWGAGDDARAWVVENVPGAPLPDPLTLCGSMFGLRAVDIDGTPLVLRRHRLFASSHLLLAPGPCAHGPETVGGVYGGGSSTLAHARNVRRGGYTPAFPVRRDLMGVDWTTQDQLSQALPPVYTEHVGLQLADALSRTRQGV